MFLLVPNIEDLYLSGSEEGFSSGSEDIFGHSINRDALENAYNSVGGQPLRQDSWDSQNGEDLVGPVPLSASLHKPTSYNELRNLQIEKLKRAGALGTLNNKKSR